MSNFGLMPLGPLSYPNPRRAPICPPTQSTPPQAGGTIIPYASGLVPLTLTAVLGTTAGVAAAVGFGGNVPIASFLGGLIDTSDILVLDYTVPRDGTITDIYANFNITAELDIGLGLEAVVQATLYRAPQGTNDFSPIPESTVVLDPPITDVIALGQVLSGQSTPLSIPVTAGERLMMVFYAVQTSGLGVTEIIGQASAGVTIR